MALVSFDIFEYIHDSRQAHGLRAQDYTRYRRFCAHHLRTVRKAAKLPQGSTAGFSKLNVTSENASSTLHVEVQLLQAERAWAYAMDLRELHSRTEEPRQRQHVVQRLKAAVKAAHTLAAIAPGFCDARTALAAAAYWLQMQSQLRFELQQWEAALDSAALARVITDRLAQAGSSHFALAHAMLEALDPIVRLAAYQMRVSGAQHATPAAIAVQWYDSNMKGAEDRVSATIPEYADISAALDKLSAPTGESVAFANELHWRGGAVSFASQELAAQVDRAQGLLKAASGDNSDSLDEMVAAYRKVGKIARRCHAESAVAAQKSQTAALDALLSAYAAVQLYSVCVLSAIDVTQLFNEAQSIAHTCGATANSADALLGWLAGPCAGSPLSDDKNAPRQPGLAQVVVCYDKIRQRLTALQHSVTEMEAKLLPAVRREIRTQQIADEAVAAEAYYTCLRNYYSALLHASPACAQYVDSLALLDMVVTENVPHATALTAQLAKRDLPPSEATDTEPWLRNLAPSPDKIAQASEAAETALPVVRGLCVGASENTKAWVHSPASRLNLVANTLASKSASVPQRVPHLVDFTADFAVVPIKPLFYDLAAPAIDFDMSAINAQADKQGTSKLGSIIGSLWGSR
ncbi:signal recognition particle subunit srp68 [Coemansia sp. RSA 551]|nr:signal recognition particle subunit srp68 [Coemansia sp. RSA 551]